MRKIWFTFLFIFAIISCEDERATTTPYQKTVYYQFHKFNIIEGAGIDMNDDGVSIQT